MSDTSKLLMKEILDHHSVDEDISLHDNKKDHNLLFLV